MKSHADCRRSIRKVLLSPPDGRCWNGCKASRPVIVTSPLKQPAQAGAVSISRATASDWDGESHSYFFGYRQPKWPWRGSRSASRPAVIPSRRRPSSAGIGRVCEICSQTMSHGLCPTDYVPLADIVAVYDNGGSEPILIADRLSGAEFVVHDTERWELMERWSRCPT
jgi:hypothetical protein